MTIDQIIKVDIAISEAMAIDGGYDTILIIGHRRRHSLRRNKRKAEE